MFPNARSIPWRFRFELFVLVLIRGQIVQIGIRRDILGKVLMVERRGRTVIACHSCSAPATRMASTISAMGTTLLPAAAPARRAGGPEQDATDSADGTELKALHGCSSKNTVVQ